MTIPRRLVRTVPVDTTDLAEAFWAQACHLHPDWQHSTIREPVDPDDFPLTGHLFGTCESGAQKADLIRAENLWWEGGIYLDSDVEVFKPLDPFLPLDGFAAWEDTAHIPNAVMGFKPAHPALKKVIELAIQRHDQGTWAAGVGVTTEVFKDRHDMLTLPPGCFYPVHYHNKEFLTRHKPAPWEFALHHWSHSWANA